MRMDANRAVRGCRKQAIDASSRAAGDCGWWVRATLKICD